MQDLRHNTQQTVCVGVLIAHNSDVIPIEYASLSWYWWHYIIKADKSVVNIAGRTWSMVPSCDGVYFLTLTATDTDKLGPLKLYINDEFGLGKPIYLDFNVISKNLYDAKYSQNLLAVEQDSIIG